MESKIVYIYFLFSYIFAFFIIQEFSLKKENKEIRNEK